MGLIKAAAGAGGGVLADQWKEYFYCDAINADVLAVKGRKKVQAVEQHQRVTRISLRAARSSRWRTASA